MLNVGTPVLMAELNSRQRVRSATYNGSAQFTTGDFALKTRSSGLTASGTSVASY